MTKRIVTIGGGTGTFVVLSGLRRMPDTFLTAIVSSADDGGSTGRLRDAYGILPPGDARQPLVALAEEDTILRELFAYRFSKGDVAGHNLGNLFITALSEILRSDMAGIREASRILRITGEVLPASERPSLLVAHLADGTKIVGEHAIDLKTLGRPRIEELSLSDQDTLLAEARRAILEADLIVLGPGDLYTSTLAALLVRGTQAAFRESKAKIAYVMNLFTKAGQTEHYPASVHVAEIERYAGRALDAILLNNASFPEEALARYATEGELPVEDDLTDDPRVTRTPLASIAIVAPVPEDPVPRSLVRHDSALLAEALYKVI